MKQSAPRRFPWWLYTIPVLLIMLIGTQVAIHSAPGRLRIALYYMGPLLVSFLAILMLIAALVHSALRRPFFSIPRVIGLLLLLAFPLSFLLFPDTQGNFVRAYPSSHAGSRNSVPFRLPLDGPITVGWGGDSPQENYHVTDPEQRWAYDLLVARGNRTFSGDSTKVGSYYVYGLSVLAPAAGRVVDVVSGLPDMAPGDMSEILRAGGNQITLQTAPGQYLVLCHLKPGSITVVKGDSVRSGQPLAQVGNSGHSSEPHLHIHLQDAPNDFGEGIPMYFDNYMLNGRRVASGMPTGGFDAQGTLKGQVVQHIR